MVLYQNILRVPYYDCWLKKRIQIRLIYGKQLLTDKPLTVSFFFAVHFELLNRKWVCNLWSSVKRKQKGKNKTKPQHPAYSHGTACCCWVGPDWRGKRWDGSPDSLGPDTPRDTCIYNLQTTQRIYLVQLWGRCRYLQRPRDKAARIRWKVASSVTL